MDAVAPEKEGLIDVLMISYDRAAYTQRSLPRVLDTCDERTRVWLWHNGDHPETLEVVRSYADHPRVHEFHHSPENLRLREPTNWFFERSDGEFLSKVDDDGLMPEGWCDTLRQAHRDVPELGIVGCWRFREEDFVPELANRKIARFGDHQILQNCWVEGSGYVMKRRVVDTVGPIRDGESFSQYGIRAALAGFVNGWYYPFLYQEDMDDPRSPYTLKRTQEDFERYASLSQQRFGVETLEQCIERQRMCALEVQEASPDPRDYVGWRGRLRRLRTRLFDRGRVARFDA